MFFPDEEVAAWHAMERRIRRGAVVFLSAIIFLIAVLAVRGAYARDDGRYAGSPLSDWYKAQQNQAGQVCCDDADGHPVTDWGRGPNGYWVVYDGKRHDVPAQALVNGMHPYGQAIVWIYPVGTDTVRCFMPGLEG